MGDNVQKGSGRHIAAARRMYIADLKVGHMNASGDSRFEEFGDVKIFGTILSKNIYRTEGKVEYGVLLVGDGSGPTIEIKSWGNSASALDKFKQGELIDVLGKVKHGKNDIFLAPEIIRRLDDPNWRTVRELEIVRDYLRRSKARIKGPLQAGIKEVDLRTEIINIIDIKGGSSGIDFTDLLKCIKHANEEEIKKTLNELLDQRTIYETRPGRYRK
jgi:hypothetical protein